MLKAPNKAPAGPTVSVDKKPARDISYQSGFNANKQAVNAGQNKSDFLRESLLKNPISSGDGQRAINDLQAGMQGNSVAQMQRGTAAQNAQQSMNDMATRSDLTRQGLANQAQIYQDMNRRAIDQMGLAGRLNEAMIRNKFAVLNQQAMKVKGSLSAGGADGKINQWLGGLLK